MNIDLFLSLCYLWQWNRPRYFLVKFDASFNLGEAAGVIACADDVSFRISLCAGFQLSCEDEQGNLYVLTFIYPCSSSLFYQYKVFNVIVQASISIRTCGKPWEIYIYIFIKKVLSSKLLDVVNTLHFQIPIMLYNGLLASSNPFFFCLGRLGRKSCSYTMCKSNGNPEICVLFHPQLWQASWGSTNGDKVLHWEVSSGFRPNSHHNPVMWFHASNYHLNENFGMLIYNISTGMV